MKRLWRSINDRRGITLVELLIALSITGVIFSALLTVWGQSERSYLQAQQQSDATFQTQNVFQEIIEGVPGGRHGLLQSARHAVGEDGLVVDAAGAFYGYYYDADNRRLYQKVLDDFHVPTADDTDNGDLPVLENVVLFVAQDQDTDGDGKWDVVYIKLVTEVPSGTGRDIGTTLETVVAPREHSAG